MGFAAELHLLLLPLLEVLLDLAPSVQLLLRLRDRLIGVRVLFLLEDGEVLLRPLVLFLNRHIRHLALNHDLYGLLGLLGWSLLAVLLDDGNGCGQLMHSWRSLWLDDVSSHKLLGYPLRLCVVWLVVLLF